jgi:hypothetical protein
MRTVRTLERPWLVLLSLVLASACANPSKGFDESKDGKTNPDGSTNPPIDEPPVDIIDAGNDGSGDDCSDAAKLVYVISDVNTLYSFTPNTLKFATIGTLACPAGAGATVNSMAVDREGTAWVNYTDGKIYKVSTKDAACTTTSFAPHQAGFTNELGMGFSSDAKGSKKETLFVSDNAGLGLGSIDLGTMKLKGLGPYTGANAGANAELTGTGDGQLFAFFATSPASYAEVTKTSGATPTAKPLSTVNASDGGYAFSFWGGDFWFYTAYPTPASPDPTTSVTRYRPSNGSQNVVLSNIGFVIVGAGVSTCAPTTPPR